jgi:hypothetical protein
MSLKVPWRPPTSLRRPVCEASSECAKRASSHVLARRAARSSATSRPSFGAVAQDQPQPPRHDHSVFELGTRIGWCDRNLVKLADRACGQGDRDVDLAPRPGRAPAAPRRPQRRRRCRPHRADPLPDSGHDGLRQGELIGMRWCNVDFDADACEWSPPTSAASSATRSPSARGDRSHSPRAWSTRFATYATGLPTQTTASSASRTPRVGGRFDRSKLVRRCNQATDGAEVRPITFHEPRNTFGTRMAAAAYHGGRPALDGTRRCEDHPPVRALSAERRGGRGARGRVR